MVEVKIRDNAEEICKEKGIKFHKNVTNVITALENGKVLGILIYDIAGQTMYIKYIEPMDNYIMADSMLRSALFIAANKNIFDVFWREPVTAELIKKLGFVKNITDCSIDITNLFLSCENCKKG